MQLNFVYGSRRPNDSVFLVTSVRFRVSNSYLLRYPTVTHLSPLMLYPAFVPHVNAFAGFMYSALKRMKMFPTLSPVARLPLSS
jgi:hypothetical protein